MRIPEPMHPGAAGTATGASNKQNVIGQHQYITAGDGVEYAELPEAMLQARRWLVWRSEDARKVPYYASNRRRNGKLDSEQDVAQFGTFEQALAVVSRFDGLAFALGPDGTGNHWQGIDLDDVAEYGLHHVVDDLPGYTEKSPSGAGWHAIGYGRSFDNLGSNKTGVEAYSAARFFTVTGDCAGLHEPECLADFVENQLVPIHRKREKSHDSAAQRVVSDEVIADLRSALNAINADDRDAWVKVGHALRELGDIGRGLWLDWSQTSDKWQPGDAQQWSTFRPVSSIGVESVFHEAQSRGWLNPRSNAANTTSSTSADTDTIAPLVDPATVTVGDMIDMPPPPRRWLLDKLLPLGVAGVLAAGGTTGKSFFVIQLAVAIVTGKPFFGIEVGEPGGALIVSAEDDREEVWRRLWRIVHHMEHGGDLTSSHKQLIRDRLFITSRVGEDNRLTAESNREVIRTYRDMSITALVELLPAPINLIALDPLARFRGGDENNNDHATRFVEVVEALRGDTGATILLPHHVSKAGLGADAERLSVEAVRGATALVDGFRWTAAMAKLRKDAASDYGIEPENAGSYVRVDLVKGNYGPPWSGMWLERLDGGVLVPVELERQKGGKKRQQDQDRYKEVLGKLQGFIRQRQEQGKPLTRYKLRTFAGRDGIFGVGDQTLRAILERAIAESHIGEREKPDGTGKELHTWIR